MLLLAVAACGRPHLVDADGDLQIAPAALDFGAVVIETPASATLSIHNASQAAQQAHLSAAAPFAIDATVEIAGGGTVDVSIPFLPQSLRPASGVLTVAKDSGPVTVALSGTGVPKPTCSPPDDCHGCDGRALADGTACTGGNVCLVGGRCSAGTCRGAPRDCDDGDACTLDVCDPMMGCQHVDSSSHCADLSDACHTGVCDPQLGCTRVDVADGTLCGPSDCTTAHVCMSGQCQQVSVPDGFTCAGASPCQGKGVCTGGTCAQPPATPLSLAWRYVAPPAITATTLQFDGVTDAAGALYWTECTMVPLGADITVYSCDLVSYMANGLPRLRATFLPWTMSLPLRQLLTNGRYIVVTADAHVVALSAATGQTLWSVVLPETRPSVTYVNATAVAADDTHVWVAAVVGTSSSATVTLFVVDAATGTATQAALTTPFTLTNVVLDSAGAAYAMVINAAGQGELWSFTPSGALRFVVPNAMSGDVMAAYNGQLVTDVGQVRSTADGALLAQADGGALFWLPGTAGETSLMSATSWAQVGTYNPCGACQSCACPAIDPSLMMARGFPAGSGVERFVETVGDGAFTQPVLLSDGSVLMAAAQPPGPAEKLRALDAQGNTLFECELPVADAGSGLTYNYLGAVALTNGAWAVVNQVGCNGCFISAPPELDVFAAPGLSEAPSGWTGQYGGPGRTCRAH
jgi:hypothetical protein